MSAARGTLPAPVAEGLARTLELTREQALAQLRTGSSGARGALEGFFGQARQLGEAVQWDQEPPEDGWWATRNGELIAISSPDDFRLTFTPQALTCRELTVWRNPDGDLAVGQGEESWVVRTDGTVLTGQAIEEAMEQGFGKLERGLEKMGQWSGARAPASLPVPECGSWMAELLGGLVALVARAAPCPECGRELTPGARFCAHCGHKLSLHPDHCPGCQAPTPPEMRFCAQCGLRLIP